MGYDVTRQGLGWTLFFFALLLLLFWKHSLAEPVPFDPLSAGDMPLGTVLAGVARRLPVFSGILSALLAFAGGVVLTRIVSRNMILLERTYMPILLYPAVGCSAYFGPESLPALAASFLTIASFDTMLVSFRRTARFGSLFNAWFLIPRFAVMYGMPLEAIIAMGTQINGSITSLSTLVLFAVVPFNLLKGVLVSVLTFFLYKHVEKLFFRRKAD